MGSNDNLDFCIVITTYNRPMLLQNLINQIEHEIQNFRVKLLVFDDNSTELYDIPEWVTVINFYPNNGKKGFWKIINTSFKFIKNIESKYYVYLQDDVVLCEDFLTEISSIYESIDDDNKISLEFRTDDRTKRPNWTDFQPVEHKDVLHTQWIELDFICEKKLFDELDYTINPIPPTRWYLNPKLSSGVGHQMSIRLNDRKKNMYHVKKSKVYHGDHDSLMNYDERINTKLVTN